MGLPRVVTVALLIAGCGGTAKPPAAPTDLEPIRERAFQAMWETLDQPTARAAFAELRRAAPADVDALTYLPLCEIDAGNRDAALAVARDFTLRHPRNATAFETLGEVQLMRGEPRDAERSFRHALTLDPHALGAVEGLASVHFHGGDWIPGLAVLREALARTTRTEDRQRLAGSIFWALVAQGNPPAALALAAELGLERAEPLLRLELALEVGWFAEVGATPGDGNWHLALRAVAAAKRGQLHVAERELAALEARPVDPARPWLANDRRWAGAHVAWAKGDLPRALTLLAHPNILNHNSLYDPRRGQGHPGFQHFALAALVDRAEILTASGRRDEARAQLRGVLEAPRVGIGAVLVRRRALALAARLAAT
jgi:tetratricopeptide (TPR) repeat protein